MNDGYGIESHAHHDAALPDRAPARFLVVIDSGGSAIARLFGADRTQVAEVDAGTEEIAQMTRGLQPAHSAGDPDWDRALVGHSEAERQAALVYTLDL